MNLCSVRKLGTPSNKNITIFGILSLLLKSVLVVGEGFPRRTVVIPSKLRLLFSEFKLFAFPVSSISFYNLRLVMYFISSSLP